MRAGLTVVSSRLDRLFLSLSLFLFFFPFSFFFLFLFRLIYFDSVRSDVYPEDGPLALLGRLQSVSKTRKSYDCRRITPGCSKP